MSRPIRVTPVTTAPKRDEVIDARFSVVKPKGGSMLASVGRWVLAFACAGIIGFLIPPAWVLAQEVMSMLKQG